MLPPGLTAQPAGAAEVVAARALLGGVQTVVLLLVGACSCDLVHERRPDPREDERHLRARFSRLGLRRDEIIRRLERHRRLPPGAAGPWAAPLAAFVAEHARNAGPSLYALRFGEEAPLVPPGAAPATRTVAEVREHPGGWLDESRPTFVIR